MTRQINQNDIPSCLANTIYHESIVRNRNYTSTTLEQIVQRKAKVVSVVKDFGR